LYAIYGDEIKRVVENSHTTRLRIPATAVGYLAVLIAAAAWGTSGIMVKFISASAEITALSLAFWRDISTFFVLLIGVRILRPSLLKVKRRDLAWLAALGGSLGIFHVFWNLGVMLNGAAVATVQQAAMPALVTTAAWMIWREPLTWRKGLAILLAFVGTVLVSGIVDLERAELSLQGTVAGMGIPVFYAAWNLFGKKVRKECHALTTLTFAFGFGALVLLPFQFSTVPLSPIQPVTMLWFAGLIFLSTILPFFLYIFALGRLPAGIASILAMTEIAFVSVYAYFLLGERMDSPQVMGTVMVVGGVSLLFDKRLKRMPEKMGVEQVKK
jgi:drug/metabolite transporter (DMT)-like permease